LHLSLWMARAKLACGEPVTMCISGLIGESLVCFSYFLLQRVQISDLFG
jgi:hypothetical protein